MNKKIISIVSIFCFAYSSYVLGSNEIDGEETNGMSYEQKLQACSTCHGVDGDKPLAPDYPVLAGQHKDYLANSLEPIRTGAVRILL